MGQPSIEDRGKPRSLAGSSATGGAIWRAAGALSRAVVFRQTLLHVAAVVTTGAIVMGLLYVQVGHVVSRQVVDALAIEAEAISDIARAAGTAAAVGAMQRRARANDGRLYLLEHASSIQDSQPRPQPEPSAASGKLWGNLEVWPAALSRTGPGGTFSYPDPAAPGAAMRLGVGVVLTLPGGMRLLVGRDLEQQQQLAERVKWLFLIGFGALALAGLVAGAITGRMQLGRIAGMTAVTDRVMLGDFSGRLQVDAADAGSDSELDHLARNLNAMLDRIEQLMAGLREVSDNIAHDLKTPLSRLRSRAEAALRDTREPSTRDALGRVIEDADDLIKTFNALLLIARLEAGAVEGTSERFDVAALTRDVVELYTPVAEEAGLVLRAEFDTGLDLVANRQLVGQAIANMIDNAIKYGRPSGSCAKPTTVDVGVRRVPGEIAISVADKGPGIAAADRVRALKRFVRLEPSRTKPGTGLGLSLVAAVARLHDGRVLLDDNSPGLRITLMLPCPP